MTYIRVVSITIIWLLFSSTSLADEQQRRAIIETVNQFFLAIETKDAELLESILIPGSLNISSSEQLEGKSELTTMDYERMISALTRPGRDAKERAWDETILIQGHIAIFWAPYDFHVDGKFSHCGVDSFQLVNSGEKWLISNASWTRETQDCPQSPLGPISQ